MPLNSSPVVHEQQETHGAHPDRRAFAASLTPEQPAKEEHKQSAETRTDMKGCKYRSERPSAKKARPATCTTRALTLANTAAAHFDKNNNNDDDNDDTRRWQNKNYHRYRLVLVD